MFKEFSREWKAGGTENYIRLVPVNHNLVEMYGNLRCGTWEIDDLVGPKEVDDGPIIELTCTYPEKEARTYEGYIVDHRTMETVGGPFLGPFEAGQHGCWTIEVVWTEPTPAPEPTPPASDDAALLLQMAQQLLLMATDLTAIAGRLRAGQVVSGELHLFLQDGSKVTLGVAPKAGLLAAALAKVRGLLR